MRTATSELFLPVPASAAFDFLVDYRNDLLWHDELKSVELISGAPGVPGCLYSGVVDWYGAEAPHELELADARAPSFIHIRAHSSGLAIDVRYRLFDIENGCELHALYRLEVSGALVLVEPFAWALFSRWIEDDLPRLPDALSQANRNRES